MSTPTERIGILERKLPRPYNPELTLGRLGARLGDLTQSFEGHIWTKAFRRPRPHLVRFIFAQERVRIEGPADLLPVQAKTWYRTIGATLDWRLLEAAARQDEFLRRRVALRPGLRPFLYEDPFEALVATILGQQLHLEAAKSSRQRFVVCFGERLGELFVFPQPARVLEARASLADLGLTRVKQKAIEMAAERALDGSLDAVLRGERSLDDLTLVGVGPWTRSWFRLHALADVDVPLLSDLGVARALAAMHGCRPEDRKALQALEDRLRPARGWAELYYLQAWAEGVRAPA